MVCFLNTAFYYCLKTAFQGFTAIKSSYLQQTRSKDQIVPKRANNCRGERSLLTTGVNLWNTYLQGKEPAGL